MGSSNFSPLVRFNVEPLSRNLTIKSDRASVVELDYGGIVELVDDEALRNDDSADQVRDALQALREGDKAAAQASYDRLREFWADVAAKQRTC